MVYNLDVKDKKILTLLDENCRYTNTQIAKRVKLSKPAVEARIQKLIKNNIIFAFYTELDVTKLGYYLYKVYYKFQNISREKENEISEFWKENKFCIWSGKVRSRWDLAVTVLARNNNQLGIILKEFQLKYSGYILEKDILLIEYTPIYSREHLVNTLKKELTITQSEKIIILDETDKKILKTISNNARMQIVGIVKNTKLTKDVVIYRLKKLKELISSYRCYPNLGLIGVNLYKLILRTRNLSFEKEIAIKGYCKEHKKITQFLKLVGSWDVEIEIEVEDENELYKIIDEIRKEFNDVIRDYDI